jgi:hypothetical protein
MPSESWRLDMAGSDWSFRLLFPCCCRSEYQRRGFITGLTCGTCRLARSSAGAPPFPPGTYGILRYIQRKHARGLLRGCSHFRLLLAVIPTARSSTLPSIALGDSSARAFWLAQKSGVRTQHPIPIAISRG